MTTYADHQNLIKKFKLLVPKEIPEMRVFNRHVGLLYTKRGTPMQINRAGMADLYCLINMGHYMMEIEIEAKTGKAVQSKHQKTWQKFIETFGGKYFLMRDERETMNEVKEYIKEVKKWATRLKK